MRGPGPQEKLKVKTKYTLVLPTQVIVNCQRGKLQGFTKAPITKAPQYLDVRTIMLRGNTKTRLRQPCPSAMPSCEVLGLPKRGEEDSTNKIGDIRSGHLVQQKERIREG